MPLKSLEEIANIFDLTDDERLFNEEKGMPILISDALIPLLSDERIRREFVPSKREAEDNGGTADPQEESSYIRAPRLIHRYKNRVAIITTSHCFSYCRHCFRRRMAGGALGPISDDEIKECASYLKGHLEVEEALLTGGDLFTLSDRRIDRLLSSLKEAREDIICRLCTRAVFTAPERFTSSLFDIIKKHAVGAPFYLMTQFNTAEEITKKASKVLSEFSSLMIPIMNQAVLLRGVNDSVEVQKALSRKLLINRVKPYYLFQGDYVSGTAHLRVPLSRTLELEEEMRGCLSGLEMPLIAIDLPEGKGKLPLVKDRFSQRDSGAWVFRALDGTFVIYPEDP